MKTDTIKEEILLITNATLFQSCLRDKESSVGVKHLPQREMLVQAYRDGLLEEMLQKNIQQTKCPEKLFIQSLYRKENSIQIILSDFCSILDKHPVEKLTSINPYVFSPELVKN